MRGVEFKDNGVKFVELGGGIYEVDGKVIELKDWNSKVQVDSFENIKPITRTNVVCYYTTNGEDKVSVEEYREKVCGLLSKRKTEEYDDDDVIYSWETLEDEFAYKKYVQLHQQVNKNIEEIGDPIKFDITSTVLETGNPFIRSEFVNGKKDLSVFSYERTSALIGIVGDCFKGLGMEFKHKCEYKDTDHKKIWGNSEHSGIRYVTAFGTYVFNDIYNNTFPQKGTLEAMMDRYESDKLAVESIIKRKYNEHFGSIDEQSFRFSELLANLRSAMSLLSKVEPKQASYSSYSSAKKKLNDSILLVEQSFKTEYPKTKTQ